MAFRFSSSWLLRANNNIESVVIHEFIHFIINHVANNFEDLQKHSLPKKDDITKKTSDFATPHLER